MNILLFGPQGSGKGTQARLMVEKFGFFYFESGAYLRRMAEKYPSIKKTMDEGKLVPDTEFTSYLTAYLDQKNLYDNIVFDGFPRTVDQYHFLKKWLLDKNVKLDLALVIEISEEESVRRLSARRLDPKTGEIYNLITEPPPSGVDLKLLIHRDDDQPEAIKRRLAIYHDRTQKLIDELQKDLKVYKLNGERQVDVIFTEIESIIQNYK
jgi:adenylate kinase